MDALDMTTAEKFERQAVDLHGQGSLQDACAMYFKAAQAYREISESQQAMRCVHALGRAAVDWVEHLVLHAPTTGIDTLVALLHIGRLLDGAGIHDEAERVYRAVCRLAPPSLEDRLVLIDLLRRPQRDSDMRAVYDAILELDPNNADANFARAVISDRWNQMDQALAHARKAASICPERRDFHVLVAQILTQLRRFDEALAAYEASFALADLTDQQRAAIARRLPPIVFVAQQRSASEYIREVFAETLSMQIYYPTLSSMPRDFVIPKAMHLVAQGGSIARLHMDARPDNIAALKAAGIDRIVVHTRDPRQATLSWTRHLARLTPQEFRFNRFYHDPEFPADYQTWSFAQQLEWTVAHFFPATVGWIAGWLAAEEMLKRDFAVMFTQYESFRDDPESFFQTLAGFYGVDLGPVEDLLARFPRERHRNFRKGEIDEWRRDVPIETQAHMWSLIPEDVARRFGWRA